MTGRRQEDERRRRAQRPRRADGVPGAPGAATAEARRDALIAADPDLRRFVRAPYVPDNGLRAGRFVTRGQLAMAESGGWRRFGAAVVACCLLVWSAIAALNLATILTARDGAWPVQVAWLLLILAVSAPLGIALLRRLLRPPVR